MKRPTEGVWVSGDISYIHRLGLFFVRFREVNIFGVWIFLGSPLKRACETTVFMVTSFRVKIHTDYRMGSF